jgi:hypothetical protein
MQKCKQCNKEQKHTDFTHPAKYVYFTIAGLCEQCQLELWQEQQLIYFNK